MGAQWPNDSSQIGDRCRRYYNQPPDRKKSFALGLLRGADVSLIVTNNDTARELRRLIRASEGIGAPGSSKVSTIAGPVIAKTINAISAGDHTLKTARLMTISAGAIVATGQTVLIRHVGSGAVAADTVVITEPCGKLGQCFVRNTTPATPSLQTVERYVRLVGPLANETGLENKTWSTTVPAPRSPGLFSLHCIWNPLATPTSIEPGTGRRLYAQRMNGVRFEIHGYPTTWNQQIQTQFTNISNLMVGRSSVLPPSTSHLLMNLVNVDIPHTGFNHFWYSQSTSDTTEVETTHYRIWIDGVDKTGIVTLGTPFPHAYAFGTIGGLTNRRIGGFLTATVPSGAYPGKTVWLDIWVTVKTYNRAWYWSGDPSLPGSYEPVCQIDSTALFDRARFRSGNVNANRFSGDQYRLNFADNGPDGLSTLNVATAGGWTATNKTLSFDVVKATTGSIDLNWSFESPVLTFASNTHGVVRYMPSGSSDYTYRNQNGSAINYGVWNPQGSTTFQPVAIMINQAFYTRGSANAPASLFTNFPSSITVEKI